MPKVLCSCGKKHDFTKGEFLACVPPNSVLQFGEYVIDPNYRAALHEYRPYYTTEEIMGSYIGYNPHFPSQDQWLQEQEESNGCEGCDGIILVDTTNDKAGHKTFTLHEINQHVPANCYTYYDDDPEGDCPLAFIVGECEAGASTTVALQDEGNELKEWMHLSEESSSYAVWEEEDGIVKHMKYLNGMQPKSDKQPSRPMTVQLV